MTVRSARKASRRSDPVRTKLTLEALGDTLAKAFVAREEAMRTNYIRVETQPDRSSVIITIHINGRDAAWVACGADDIDDLLRKLTAARAELEGGGSVSVE